MMENIDQLISSYLAGEVSSKEMEALKSWIDSSEANKQTFLKVKCYWDAKSENVSVTRNIIEDVENKVNTLGISGNGQKDNFSENSSGKLNSRTWLGIAASLILLISLGYLYVDGVGYFEKKESEPQKISYIERQVPQGKKATFLLEDGTKIKMNAGSSIRFAEQFVAANREVYLEGEAFFQVAHDAKRPFIIHTGDFTTTVLGTSFNVKAYPGLDYVGVSVASGKVKVESKHSEQPLFLNPSEAAAYDKSTKEIKREPFSEKAFFWKDGKMAFEGATFEDITGQLELWYGVTFEVNRKIDPKDGFSGVFENESLENILLSFSYAGDFKFRIKDQNVVIY